MIATFNHIKTKKPVFAVSSEDYKPLSSSVLISKADDLPEFPFELSETNIMLSAIPKNQLTRDMIYHGLRAFVNANKFWLTIFKSGLEN